MRLRFQFRLRTLLIAVTLLAVPLGYVGWQAKIVRERTTVRQRIANMGAKFTINIAPDIVRLEHSPMPWPRNWLGMSPLTVSRFPRHFQVTISRW
jgi:hypothetical protein